LGFGILFTLLSLSNRKRDEGDEGEERRINHQCPIFSYEMSEIDDYVRDYINAIALLLPRVLG
jgi:hypothetical protein